MCRILSITFVAYVVIQLGCKQDVPRDYVVEERTNGDFVVKTDDNEYLFPEELEYDGRIWKRVRMHSENHARYVGYDYFGSDSNEKLVYQFGTPICDIERTYSIYKRKGRHYPWFDNGLYTAIEKSGREFRTYLVWEEGGGHGPLSYTYNNGKLKFEGNEQHDSRTGPARGFYPDGSLWWKGNYTDGDIDLYSIQFYEKDGREKETRTREEAYNEFERWGKLSVPK